MLSLTDDNESSRGNISKKQIISFKQHTATPKEIKEIPGTAFCLINLYTRGLRRESKKY
jgi:hypothetical protein